MSINIILLGAPGSGKGTQAALVGRRYGIPVVSTGNMLRDAVQAGSALGRQVAETMAAGALVGDAIMGDLLLDRLRQSDVARGFVLEGFPRTIVQARHLDEITPGRLLVPIFLAVPPDALIGRLARRRLCRECHAIHGADATGAQPDRCLRCGGTLQCRGDDDLSVARLRLRTFACVEHQLVEYYQDRPAFASVDGSQQPDLVAATVFAHIERLCAESRLSYPPQRCETVIRAQPDR